MGDAENFSVNCSGKLDDNLIFFHPQSSPSQPQLSSWRTLIRYELNIAWMLWYVILVESHVCLHFE